MKTENTRPYLDVIEMAPKKNKGGRKKPTIVVLKKQPQPEPVADEHEETVIKLIPAYLVSVGNEITAFGKTLLVADIAVEKQGCLTFTGINNSLVNVRKDSIVEIKVAK